MEQQHNFENEETPTRDFVQGFNHCEILADLAPDILTDISPVNSPESEYFNGFFAAKAHLRENEIEQFNLDSITSIRTKSREQENELERE